MGALEAGNKSQHAAVAKALADGNSNVRLGAVRALSTLDAAELLPHAPGLAKLLEERRAERRDDLMSALIDAEIDGQTLSQEELLGFCFLPRRRSRR